MSRNVARGTKPVNQEAPRGEAKVVYPPHRAHEVECGVCGFRWLSRGKGLFYKCPRCYRSSSGGHERGRRGAKHDQADSRRIALGAWRAAALGRGRGRSGP